MKPVFHLAIFALSVLAAADATTYQVGPGRFYLDLNELLDSVTLSAGDRVEVDGNASYAATRVRAVHSGAPGNPVMVVGVDIAGLAPRFQGGYNTLHNEASHIIFENLDITQGSGRCFFHQGTGVVLRRVVIHDCPEHGILGADQQSGSLTVEHSAVINAGSGGRKHAIYMATDEVNYPGSVFRLQHSTVVDSAYGSGEGGNLIKSRAERNEIYYNWLEGAYYHELELIGPDPGGAPPGWTESIVREDSDVVGNVIVHSAGFGSIIRLGGDATGQTYGRYRFVNNTIVRINGGSATVFRLFDGLESLLASNNVFYNAGGASLRVVRETEADWLSNSTRISGQNNWIQSGATFTPSGFVNTIVAGDPGFENLAALDLRPASGSTMLNGGVLTLTGSGDYAIDSPLARPVRHPPRQPDDAVIGPVVERPISGEIDVGAFEAGVDQRIFRSGFE